MTASWSAAYAPHGSPVSSGPADRPALRWSIAIIWYCPAYAVSGLIAATSHSGTLESIPPGASASSGNPVPCTVYQILAPPRSTYGTPVSSHDPDSDNQPTAGPPPHDWTARYCRKAAPAGSDHVPLGVFCRCRHAHRGVDAGQRQNFLFREPRGDLLNCQPPVLAAELRQIGHQDVDAGLPGERIAAALHDLRPVPAVAVLHHHHDGAAGRDQVHSAADAAADHAVGLPVGETALGVHLVGAEDDGVYPAAPHHLEGGHAVEIGDARARGDGVSARVEDVRVRLVVGNDLAVAEDPVLAVQDEVPVTCVGGQVARYAEAEVDVRAFGQERRGQFRHLPSRPGGLAVVGAGDVLVAARRAVLGQ